MIFPISVYLIWVRFIYLKTRQAVKTAATITKSTKVDFANVAANLFATLKHLKRTHLILRYNGVVVIQFVGAFTAAFYTSRR